MTEAIAATHVGIVCTGETTHSYEWLGKTFLEASPQPLPAPWLLIIAMVVLLMVAVVLLFKEW